MEILVRQAHPGPGVPPYRDFELKWRDGERYKEQEAIPWDVLVDDLEGTTHQVYGGLSDPIYLIDRAGNIAFYNMFANAPSVHKALEALEAQGGRGVVNGGLDRFPHLAAALTNGWPGLQRGLPQSFWDLMVATPGSPVAVWLGWKLRGLLGPFTLRATPLPAPLRYGLYGLGLVAGVLGARWVWKASMAGLPVREHTMTGPLATESPTPVPREAQHGSRPMQLTHDGEGLLFHRRYRADVALPNPDARALMARIQADPDAFSPQSIAVFEKIRGEEGRMRVGDEFHIHITGPWDGPVRVIDVTPTSFALVTLEGHVEAGEIRFRLSPHPTRQDALRFEILSWARSRDKLVDFGYDKLGVIKKAQTTMWVQFVERVVAESGGELIGEIDVVTEEQPYRGEVIPRE